MSNRHLRTYIFYYFTEKLEGWNTEFALESLCCALNGTTTSAFDSYYEWGNPLSIGVFLVTTRQNAVVVVIDALRTEWSLQLAKFLERGLL